jgi:hypothetical protein
VVVDKEAFSVHKHYFPAAVLCNSLSQFYVGFVFGLHSRLMRLFSFYPQASGVGETHSLVPGAVS